MNNNRNYVLLFQVDYAKTGNSKCKQCSSLIGRLDLRIGSNSWATGHDGFVTHWYHLDCIFLSPYVPQFLKDIGNLYLIKYADQVRIIKNIGLPYDPNCDLEIEVKAQNDELFAFKETIQTFKKKQLKEFFYHNSYPTPRGQQLTFNRAAEFLTFGVTGKCSSCGFGNLIYENNIYQCRSFFEGIRCMAETSIPDRQECNIPPVMQMVFSDYTHRVKNRALRPDEVGEHEPHEAQATLNGRPFNSILNHENDGEYEQDLPNVIDVEPFQRASQGDGEPSSKMQKVFISNNIANDSDLKYAENSHIYKDISGKVYACTLYKVDIALNKNSFYKMKVYKKDNGDGANMLTEYGRTNVNRSFAFKENLSIYSACEMFQKKFKEKTGNDWNDRYSPAVVGKYVFLAIDYQQKALSEKVSKQLSEQLDTDELEKPLNNLMKLLFNAEIMKNTLIEMEFDPSKILPHGMLSVENLNHAEYFLLSIWADLEDGKEEGNRDHERNSSEFYKLVPQSSGNEVLAIINTREKVLAKLQVLNDLRSMEITYKFTLQDQNLSDSYRRLNTKITQLDSETDAYTMIAIYATNTFSEKHSKLAFKIEEIFEIERDGDEDRFQEHKKCSNRWLLWHGTPVVNVASILKYGLKINPSPNVTITGKMFGRGIYFADMSSKAAMFLGRRSNGKAATLLLCEVALGESYEVTRKLDANFSREDLPANKDSLKARGFVFPEGELIFEDGIKVPCGYQQEESEEEFDSDVNFNEFIIFDETRVKIRYLVQIAFTNDD